MTKSISYVTAYRKEDVQKNNFGQERMINQENIRLINQEGTIDIPYDLYALVIKESHGSYHIMAENGSLAYKMAEYEELVVAKTIIDSVRSKARSGNHDGRFQFPGEEVAELIRGSKKFIYQSK